MDQQSNKWTVKSVAEHVGLSTHVLRIWERRYGAILPERTETNRRYYSDADVERLYLLGQLTRQGHAISHLAPLVTEELKKLNDKNLPKVADTIGVLSLSDVTEIKNRVNLMEAPELRHFVESLCIQYGSRLCVENILSPLLNEIGCMWERGELRIAHEHMVSEVVRDVILNLKKQFVPSKNGTTVVVAIPHGHFHSLGGLMASYILQTEGCNVVYLGDSLPAEEIINTCQQVKAQYLALSLVFPVYDQALISEFDLLKNHLTIPWIVGGNINGEFELEIKKRNGFVLRSFKELRDFVKK